MKKINYLRSLYFYYLGCIYERLGYFFDDKLFSLHSKVTDWLYDKYQNNMNKSLKLDKEGKIWKYED